jgi:hypothetical protein
VPYLVTMERTECRYVRIDVLTEIYTFVIRLLVT